MSGTAWLREDAAHLPVQHKSLSMYSLAGDLPWPHQPLVAAPAARAGGRARLASPQLRRSGLGRSGGGKRGSSGAPRRGRRAGTGLASRRVELLAIFSLQSALLFPPPSLVLSPALIVPHSVNDNALLSTVAARPRAGEPLVAPIGLIVNQCGRVLIECDFNLACLVPRPNLARLLPKSEIHSRAPGNRWSGLRLLGKEHR